MQLCTVVWAVRIEKVALVVGLSCAQVAPASVCIALESCESSIFFFFLYEYWCIQIHLITESLMASFVVNVSHYFSDCVRLLEGLLVDRMAPLPYQHCPSHRALPCINSLYVFCFEAFCTQLCTPLNFCVGVRVFCPIPRGCFFWAFSWLV